jgi:hypothetical protein
MTGQAVVATSFSKTTSPTQTRAGPVKLIWRRPIFPGLVPEVFSARAGLTSKLPRLPTRHDQAAPEAESRKNDNTAGGRVQHLVVLQLIQSRDPAPKCRARVRGRARRESLSAMRRLEAEEARLTVISRPQSRPRAGAVIEKFAP